MFFTAAKIFWIIAKPLNLILILLLLANLLLWSRWRRFGAWLTGIVTLALLAVAVLPIGEWALAPLSDRFAPIETGVAGPVDGIVLLSGSAVNLDISGQIGHAVPGSAAARLVEFIRLARAYPKARLLICGGNAGANGMREGPLIADYLVSRGFDRSRLLVENASLDTYENAVFGRDLAKPAAGERWLLVTSAWHMPRAMAVFRTQGWPVVAAPPQPRSAGKGGFALRFKPGLGLRYIGTAMHEYLGLLAYRIRGRSNTLWPAP
ncbi:MAG: YdcF family protein [Alphaproteobacteria bacterium]|nr:YdcF family protein [Alphaproteobacteria bacterium]